MDRWNEDNSLECTLQAGRGCRLLDWSDDCGAEDQRSSGASGSKLDIRFWLQYWTYSKSDTCTLRSIRYWHGQSATICVWWWRWIRRHSLPSQTWSLWRTISSWGQGSTPHQIPPPQLHFGTSAWTVSHIHLMCRPHPVQCFCQACVTLDFTTQKNSVDGKVITHGVMVYLFSSPMRALSRRMVHLYQSGTNPDRIVASYWWCWRCGCISSIEFSTALNISVKILGAELEFLLGNVSERSLQVAGPMSLIWLGIETNMIRLWISKKNTILSPCQGHTYHERFRKDSSAGWRLKSPTKKWFPWPGTGWCTPDHFLNPTCTSSLLSRGFWRIGDIVPPCSPKNGPRQVKLYVNIILVNKLYIQHQLVIYTVVSNWSV